MLKEFAAHEEHHESRLAASNGGPEFNACHAVFLHGHQPRRAPAASVNLSA